MKILVVEDDHSVRNALLDILKYKQYPAEGAATAEEALVKLPGDFGLIISDILLEGMDGVALLERVNAMESSIPVVMISGYGDAALEEQCRKRGAAGFLKKPFTVPDIIGLVEAASKTM